MSPVVRKDQSYLIVQNTKLYYQFYESHPSKPLLFMIHGFLASSFSFRKMIPYLHNEFNILLIDLPGFGLSEKPKDFRYSLENYAKMMLEILDSFSYSVVYTVGHSLGGQIALRMAYHSPDCMEKLILINSAGYLTRLPRVLSFLSYLPFFPLFFERWLRKIDPYERLKNNVYHHEVIDRLMFEGYTKILKDPLFIHTLIGLLRHKEDDLTDLDLQRIHTPIQLIWGEKDIIVPLRIGKRLHEDLPRSTITIIPETGHLLMEEIPFKLVRVIHEAISR